MEYLATKLTCLTFGIYCTRVPSIPSKLKYRTINQLIVKHHRNKHGTSKTLNAWNPLFNGIFRTGKLSTFETLAKKLTCLTDYIYCTLYECPGTFVYCTLTRANTQTRKLKKYGTQKCTRVNQEYSTIPGYGPTQRREYREDYELEYKFKCIG